MVTVDAKLVVRAPVDKLTDYIKKVIEKKKNGLQKNSRRLLAAMKYIKKSSL